MALPQSPISLANLQTEYDGVRPISLKSYYEGGVYVSPYSVSAPFIPASGALSLGNFRGASSTIDAYQILSYVWDSRVNLFRGMYPSGAVVAWPGDTRGINSSYQRDVSSATASETFENSGLQSYGSNCTVIVWAAGASPSLTSVDITSSDSGATSSLAYGPDNTGDGSLSVYHVTAPMPTITGITETWSRSNSNTGSWPGFFILPGLWNLRTYSVGVTAGTRMPRGEISVFFAASAGDASEYVPSTGISTDINWTSWWYNSYGVQINVNTTDGDLTYSSGLGSTYRCFFFEQVG